MLLSLIAASAVAQGGVVDLLPDCIIWEQYLAQAYVGTTFSDEPPAGRRALRFPTTTVNIGMGTLELLGQTPTGSLQPVNQRIYRSNGTFYDRLAGNFTYHSNHGHMHFDDWTHFRLREVLPGNGVGPIVRTGVKQSFCIIETTVYDSSMPGYNNSAWGPYSCGWKQGTRPGRADTYGATLSGQYIDIVGLPDGVYWLEGEVDPLNHVLELDESNNIARVLVNIGSVPPAQPDRFEENDTLAQTAARTEGAENSPNFGIVNSKRTYFDLSMDDNDDWYRFRLNNTGGPGDYVRIDTPYQSGQNLYLHLYNSSGTLLTSVTNTYAVKQISLNNRAAGAYFIRVQRNTGNNPNYLLTIDPAGNLPPSITITHPAMEHFFKKNYDVVPVRWTCSDPEGDPKTVSLLIDRNPVVGDTNIQVTGYENLRGSDLEANLNTAAIPVGKWWVVGRASDGGAFNFAISPAPFWLFIPGDVDYDGGVTRRDYDLAFRAWETQRITPEILHAGDLNHDGILNKIDLKMLDKMTSTRR